MRSDQRNDTESLLTYEEGQEYAPDDPRGLEFITLCDDGAFTYRRSRAGVLVGTRSGSIALERAHAIFVALADSTFPDVPDHQAPPGPSMVTISMPPDRRASLYRKLGMTLDGYREASAELTDIVAEARAVATIATCDPVRIEQVKDAP